MQCFLNRHWDFNRYVDLDFGALSAGSTRVIIEDPKEGPIEFVLDCSPDKRRSHCGLDGRATNIFPVTRQKFNSRGSLVVKLLWNEESRIAEPHTLKKVYDISEKEPDVKRHVPMTAFFYGLSDSSTSIVCERLGLQKNSSRILYVIVFQELRQMSTLTGAPLLRCWWQTVTCDHLPPRMKLSLTAAKGHLALWKHGVYHRDVSASNLMYKGSADDPVGVLNDFDLATTTTSVTENERTGTLPFMALGLLTRKGLTGEVKHTYAHDVESFIWTLTWICLRYEDGKLHKRPPLDAWLQVDASGCSKEKCYFLISFLNGWLKMTPGKGHEQNWHIAKVCLNAVFKSLPLPDEDCDEAFQRFLGQAEKEMSGGIH